MAELRDAVAAERRRGLLVGDDEKIFLERVGISGVVKFFEG